MSQKAQVAFRQTRDHPPLVGMSATKLSGFFLSAQAARSFMLVHCQQRGSQHRFS
jgi:hypothetical protein